MTVGLKSWLLQLAMTSMVGTGVETFILTYTSERGLFQFRSLQLTYRYKYEDQSKLSTNLGQSFTCQVGYRPPCKTQNMVGFFFLVGRLWTIWMKSVGCFPHSGPGMTKPILVRCLHCLKRPFRYLSMEMKADLCAKDL